MSSSEPGRKIKLTDIAQRAGVSVASVSRYINQPDLLSMELRSKIESAVAHLGYEVPKPDTAGNFGSEAMVMLITDPLNMYLHELVNAAQDEIGNSEVLPIVINTTHDVNRQRELLQLLTEHGARGVIACGSDLRAADWVAFYEASGIPLVVEGMRVNHPNIYSVMVDFEQAARRITQHLISLGHTRIGYLPGPAGSEHSIERRRGIARALDERGLSLRPELCPSVPNTQEGAFQGTAQLLALPPALRPTALISYNDMLALGALNAVRTHGLRVPDDISVVGFDDILIAAHTAPALTTVAIPKRRIGMLAAQWLLRTWAQPAGTQPQGGLTLLESPLVMRESTGPRAG